MLRTFFALLIILLAIPNLQSQVPGSDRADPQVIEIIYTDTPAWGESGKMITTTITADAGGITVQETTDLGQVLRTDVYPYEHSPLPDLYSVLQLRGFFTLPDDVSSDAQDGYYASLEVVTGRGSVKKGGWTPQNPVFEACCELMRTAVAQRTPPTDENPITHIVYRIGPAIATASGMVTRQVTVFADSILIEEIDMDGQCVFTAESQLAVSPLPACQRLFADNAFYDLPANVSGEYIPGYHECLTVHTAKGSMQKEGDGVENLAFRACVQAIQALDPLPYELAPIE